MTTIWIITIQLSDARTHSFKVAQQKKPNEATIEGLLNSMFGETLWTDQEAIFAKEGKLDHYLDMVDLVSVEEK